MERDGSSVQVPASASSAPADAAASPREVLAQQLASGNIDRSSIYAQLTSNPFFTAVRHSIWHFRLYADDFGPRGSVSQLWALLQQLVVRPSLAQQASPNVVY